MATDLLPVPQRFSANVQVNAWIFFWFGIFFRSHLNQELAAQAAELEMSFPELTLAKLASVDLICVFNVNVSAGPDKQKRLGTRPGRRNASVISSRPARTNDPAVATDHPVFFRMPSPFSLLPAACAPQHFCLFVRWTLCTSDFSAHRKNCRVQSEPARVNSFP